LAKTALQRIYGELEKHPAAFKAAQRAREMQGLARRPRQIRKYLAQPRDFTGLQVGAGHTDLDHWLKTDLQPSDLNTVYMDAAKRFPFPDGTFDYIVAEHIIQDFSHESALAMLRECHRTLKDGGVVRISTPDIELTHRLMDPPLEPALERYVSWSNRMFGDPDDPDSAVHVVNRLQHAWGHQFLYDHDTLAESLRRAGFAKISSHAPNESGYAALTNVDRHGVEIGEEFNALESLIVEAVKTD
jgi:predicted SAM-dependent methyltransferase